jgi:DNA replication protein DnaC
LIPNKKLSYLKSKIKNDCSCSNGCRKCSIKIRRVDKYAVAKIPVDYWELSFKNNFKGDGNFGSFVMAQIKDVAGIYERGDSFSFVGNLGTGKTFAATSILKMALLKGFSAKYYNMDQVIRDAISPDSKEFLEEITNIDFICIDEYDSRWVFPSEKSEQLFGQTMESILRSRFQNGMPTIICSNTSDLKTVLSGDFARATESLFSKYMRILYVAGKDFRRI